MAKPGPKYSILIPTRNGARYLPSTVRSVLNQDYESCEVIVSVNHSSDGSLDVLKQFADPRLQVVIPPRPLSMGGHFEWLQRQAKGEWLVVLGDDDALMPYFFSESDQLLARWPSAQVFVSRRAYYFWPDCESIHGSVVVRYQAEEAERSVSSRAVLFECIAGTEWFVELPQLYTGNIVCTDLVHRIVQKSGGRFYFEPAPDVYSGVAIALATKTFVRTELPLFWVGTSPKSVGLSLTKQNSANADAEAISRSNDFWALNNVDGLQAADDVGTELWSTQASPMLVLSALRMVPFVPRFWRGRWATYLAFAALNRKLRRRRGTEDRPGVNVTRAIALAQMARLNLGKGTLRLAAIALRTFVRWRKAKIRVDRALRSLSRKAFRMGRTAADEKYSIVSDCRHNFPQIESASDAVSALYRRKNTRYSSA